MEDGLVTLISRRSVSDTIDALAAAVVRAGLVVFARIDHAANAANVGMKLRPTEVIIFGGHEKSAILMEDEQAAGLDLPMRAVAWEDENGETWLTYNDPHWIGARHRLGVASRDVLHEIEAAMVTMARAATGS